MCGICGVVTFGGEPVEADRLSRSCQALHHRGPDHAGTWIDPAGGMVGLGTARLSILDTSSAGNQPMHRGRYHLVHNGEVYNFRELRAELSALGDVFETDSDTEVVLSACARWGPDALNRFNGMWALCFYDSETRAGFVARDRFGEKPLIYSLDANRLCFASELRALRWLGGFDGAIDDYSVRHHLQFGYIPHPHTIYRSARRLPPGHFLRFAAHGLPPPALKTVPPTGPERFYDPIRRFLQYTTNDSHSAAHHDAPFVASSLRRSVAAAVSHCRVSDVPIGAFLSGGLDSSIIVSHLAEVMTQPVKTFCVGFEGHRSFDERHFARLVAQRFGTDHHEIVLSHREVIASIPAVLSHLGEPFGDASIVPTALLSQFAQRHVTVALSGDGGDELFAGYWRYTAHATLSAYRRIPSMLRRGILEPALANLASVKGGGISNRVRQLRKLLRAEGAVSPIARHIAWSGILAPEAEGIFADGAEPQNNATDGSILSIAESLADGYAPDDPLNRILAFDLQYQLPADMLHKVDMASMMHSLEVRVPFLDYRVVEAALGLPSSMKLDRGQRKRILIDAYRGRLPDEVLDRGKQGFELPFGEYLRGPLRSMFEDVVTPDAVARFPQLSYAGVRQVFDEHLARRADHTDLLFALLSLCWWRP